MKTALVCLSVLVLSTLGGCGSPGGALVGATWSRGGEAVPSSEVDVRGGPSHCGWQSSTWLDLARADAAPPDTHLYLRDPEDEVPVALETTLDTDADLPDDAIYVVFDDHVERWPRASDRIACE